MPEQIKTDLQQERVKIDKIDDSILRLIHDRVKSVHRIGELKGNRSSAVYRPDREKSIFNRLLKANQKHPFPDSAMVRIFQEIISACRSLEAPIKVAYMGPKGSFSHMAAVGVFGEASIFADYKNVSDIFKEMESGKEAYGIVPIENSQEGIVNVTLDMLAFSPLKIIGEYYQSIHHCLLSREKKLSEIKTVYSHPQPFGQCRNWLKAHLPQAQLKEVSSTSEAAKLCQSRKQSAAIASSFAGDIYKLNQLAENIEDSNTNTTRFVALAAESHNEKSERDKTSLYFTLRDKPGALNDILSILGEKNINMTKIVSRPSKRKAFEYGFFVDLEGHENDEKLKQSLIAIESKTTFIKRLGSYPIGFPEA